MGAHLQLARWETVAGAVEEVGPAVAFGARMPVIFDGPGALEQGVSGQFAIVREPPAKQSVPVNNAGSMSPGALDGETVLRRAHVLCNWIDIPLWERQAAKKGSTS